MRRLAQLLDVHDAVLIAKNDKGELTDQTWREPEPGFSAIREHREEKPIDLLSPLAPPKPPYKPPDDRVIIKPPVVIPEEPLLSRTWVRASIVGTIAAAVIGGIVWARQTDYIKFGSVIDIKQAMP